MYQFNNEKCQTRGLPVGNRFGPNEPKAKLISWWYGYKHARGHRRQEPFCVDHKTYAKLSAFVKYVIKFVGRANPITNFEFVEEYVKNNKQNIYLIFIFLPYPIPNLDYVSYTRFNCVVIAKPFRYLNYEEDNTIKPCVAYIV